MNTLSLFADSAASALDPPPPERIPCISLWEPYATLVIAGIKTIETRTWPWPYPPGWLVIHRAKHVDRESFDRLMPRIRGAGMGYLNVLGGRGAAAGIVYVSGCRRLEAADIEAACLGARTPGNGEPVLYAWTLEKARVFEKPLAMRGPQKFVFLSRKTVVACLGGAT